MDLDTNIAPETERAKFSVLSQASEDLLRECWKTWRLSQPYRAVLYLELIKNRMDTVDFHTDIDIEEARDAMRAIDKCLKENEIRHWTINDVSVSSFAPLWKAKLFSNFSVKILFEYLKV